MNHPQTPIQNPSNLQLDSLKINFQMTLATQVSQMKTALKMETAMSSQQKNLSLMNSWSVVRQAPGHNATMHRRIHFTGPSEAVKQRAQQIFTAWQALLISFSSIRVRFVGQRRRTLLQHKNRRPWRQHRVHLRAHLELFCGKSANLLECWRGNLRVQRRTTIKIMT